MSRRHPLYRAVVLLYPKEFRRDYGDDLVRHYDDLVADRGTATAWCRTALDAVLTVPRFRLESVMNARHSDHTITVIAGLLVVVGAAMVFTVDSSGWAVLAVGLVLAIAQRSHIARSMRSPDTGARRRRLRISALLGAIFVASYFVFSAVVGDSWTMRETVIAVIGNLAMVGAIGFLAAGLLTPRRRDDVKGASTAR